MRSYLILGMLKGKFFFGIIAFFLDSFGLYAQIDTNIKDEQYRPLIHFSPKEKWVNDPNGMVYHNGIYHLFYQYHPYSSVWGPMHWGHATSKDLVHWKRESIKIFPDSLGTIFSGSAVVDKNNTSGFGKKDIAPLVAIFTRIMKQEKEREKMIIKIKVLLIVLIMVKHGQNIRVTRY